jgi:hypothetical protein
MSPSLSFLLLMPAMQRLGCPICRIRYEREKGYLDNLLLNHITDGVMQNSIIGSLGYCPSHTWEAGLLEKGIHNDSVKNSMMYENLVQKLTKALVQYRFQEQSRDQGIFGWFHHLLRKEKPPAFKRDPFTPLISRGCDICEFGEQAEKLYLSYLIEGFCEENNEFRQGYRSSDGLCLYHFRQAFTIIDPKFNDALRFLVDATIQKTITLGCDLTSFIDKHAWEHCYERMSDSENTSWVRAMRFFGRNEENTFLEVNDCGKLGRNFPDKEEKCIDQ